MKTYTTICDYSRGTLELVTYNPKLIEYLHKLHQLKFLKMDATTCDDGSPYISIYNINLDSLHSLTRSEWMNELIKAFDVDNTTGKIIYIK